MEICEKRWNEDFGSLKFGKIQFYDFLISFRILDGNQAIIASIERWFYLHHSNANLTGKFALVKIRR